MPSASTLTLTDGFCSFIVMDRDGKVLANGIQSTAPAALQQLDVLLKQPMN